MPKKVYAIKEGFNNKENKKIENLIVDTWAECLKYVKGVKGAKYKSFESREEAVKYLESNSSLKKSENTYPKDCLHIYVDGSYNSTTKEYSYGFVAVYDDVIMHIQGEAFKSESKSNIRQIAGELKAAMLGAKFAFDNNYKKVVIFHDYMGIANHATGEWDRKEQSSKDYYEKMQSFINNGLDIIFVKVDSHTGDFYNEMADEICKLNLGINSDKVVSKYINSNIIKVSNNNIKNIILKIAPESPDNIKVASQKQTALNLVQKENNVHFESVIREYKNDSKKALEQIKKFSQTDKDNFIIYMLENKL